LRARLADVSSDDEAIENQCRSPIVAKQDWKGESWKDEQTYWKFNSWYGNTKNRRARSYWSQDIQEVEPAVSANSSSSWQSYGPGNGYDNKSEYASSWQGRNGKAEWTSQYDGKANWSEQRSRPTTKRFPPRKPQCQFTIGIEEDETFGVVRRLIGVHGKHVKSMAAASGAKFRLRGRGSGFLEGPESKESPDPLMLCVSAQDNESYELAKELVCEHLETVYKQYRAHCAQSGKRLWPDVKIKVNEGPRDGHF